MELANFRRLSLGRRKLLLFPTADEGAVGNYCNFRRLPNAVGSGIYLLRPAVQPSEVTGAVGRTHISCSAWHANGRPAGLFGLGFVPLGTDLLMDVLDPFLMAVPVAGAPDSSVARPNGLD
jgi:hypothetical protein